MAVLAEADEVVRVEDCDTALNVFLLAFAFRLLFLGPMMVREEPLGAKRELKKHRQEWYPVFRFST